MIAISNSNTFSTFALRSIVLVVGMLLALSSLAVEAPQTPRAKAQSAYEAARLLWRNSPADPAAAWQFARACFDLAELDEEGRAKIAQEGIDACRKSLARQTNAGAYYYLALNLGQLARTKSLGALRLVSEMEEVFQKAIAVDPKFDYAGPHRSLGLLYRDAPGWPASIGSRSKSKQHLLKAVQLVPEYPDNQISLIESYLAWGDLKTARAAVSQAEPRIRQARLDLTGERWQASWQDWDRRWERIRRRTAMDLTSPRSKQ
jgi:hypothetical protein